MAMTVVFDAVGMSRDQYEAVIKDLASRGEESPQGRRTHIASEKPGGFLVVDVWESPEQFQRFAGVLVPVLQAAGVTPPEPQVYQTHTLAAA